MRRVFTGIGCGLGIAWSLVWTVLFWVCCGLWLVVTRQVQQFKRGRSGTLIWDLRNNGWFCRRAFTARGWGGFSMGNNIVVIDANVERWDRTIAHEHRHCLQQYVAGPFFYLLYGLDSVVIWLFVRSWHSYYDNWFEKDARRAVGQMEVITRDHWDSPFDRWAWW